LLLRLLARGIAVVSLVRQQWGIRLHVRQKFLGRYAIMSLI
jgi:hypothetical protein